MPQEEILEQIDAYEQQYLEYKRVFESDGVITEEEQACLDYIDETIGYLRDALQSPATGARTIHGSVGKGGDNDAEDVRVVQRLLVDAGYNLGSSGPDGDGVDGDCGTKTVKAISKFQDATFGWEDGLVEPGRQTWGALCGETPSDSGDSGDPDDVHDDDDTPTVTPSGGPSGGGVVCDDESLEEMQADAVASAIEEWEAGVREEGGSNRGEAVDEYVKNSGVKLGSKWCGAFVGFVLEEAGFKHAPNLASRTKARDYFLYRDLHSKPGSAKNDELDELRAQHEASGSGREFYILEGSDSDTAKKAKTPGIYGKKKYEHYDLEANTFDYSQLPIRPGDVALFNRGHVGVVKSYDPKTGKLVTIEGNAGGGERADGTIAAKDAVVKKTYDLSKEEDRKQFDGFGRPSAGDFEGTCPPAA